MKPVVLGASPGCLTDRTLPGWQLECRHLRCDSRRWPVRALSCRPASVRCKAFTTSALALRCSSRRCVLSPVTPGSTNSAPPRLND